jgi:hypothetical protein
MPTNALKYNKKMRKNTARRKHYIVITAVNYPLNICIRADALRPFGSLPNQPSVPGFGLRYCILSGLPFHSSASAGAAFLRVMFGHFCE